MTTALPPNYKEELAAQAEIIKKAKERYQASKEEANQIREQAEKRETELQQLLAAHGQPNTAKPSKIGRQEP